MEKNSFIELIEKYLSGSATETERQLAEEYMKKMEKSGSANLEEEEEEKLKQAMWLQIQRHTGTHSAKIVKIPWYEKRIVRLTGAVAAACAIIIFIWKPRTISSNNEIYQTVAVVLGQPIQKVTLPDGTLVWVKPNSTLVYPKVFAGELRKIDLKGEALFEVAKDSLHPFIVHSDNMDVRVVGTSFNIKDTKGQNTVEVAVLTGRVWVDPPAMFNSDKIELQPYDKLIIRGREGILQKEKFTSGDSYIVGTEYDMDFVNKPVDSIIQKIEKKFDVVIINDGLKQNDCRISGNFTDRSLPLTIDVLCKSLGATYTRNMDTIRISNLKCK